MNEKELNEAINAGATYSRKVNWEKAYAGQGNWNKAVYYRIPESVVRRYYTNLLVLEVLPFILLLIAIIAVAMAYNFDRMDIAISVLVLVCLLAFLLNYFFGLLGPFLPFRSVNSEEDRRHRFPSINAPISEWVLKNIRCPACNGPIKNYAWRSKWAIGAPIDLCEVQCKNCNRRFVFDKCDSKTLVLVDEIKRAG
jgi:hypothetical protein